MVETAKGRLAKLCAALIIKIGRWEDALAEHPERDLQPGIDLMHAQLVVARKALDSDSPIGLVKAMGMIDEHHTDLGC